MILKLEELGTLDLGWGDAVDSAVRMMTADEAWQILRWDDAYPSNTCMVLWRANSEFAFKQLPALLRARHACGQVRVAVVACGEYFGSLTTENVQEYLDDLSLGWHYNLHGHQTLHPDDLEDVAARLMQRALREASRVATRIDPAEQAREPRELLARGGRRRTDL